MLLGNAFHFVGPKTLKAWDANVFLLVLGTSSNLTCAFDLSPDLLDFSCQHLNKIQWCFLVEALMY